MEEFESPYVREDELAGDEVPADAHGCVLEETIFAHMSLTGLEGVGKEKRREVEETRTKILKTISLYRREGRKFLIGTGEATIGVAF